MLAGEASGDAHGARVAAEILERWPDAELTGLGGPRLAAVGARLLEDIDALAAMGFAEVAARIPFFLRLERRIARLLDGGGIDLVLPIDFPGFNLRVVRRAAKRGIPVLYYVGPQVWAWRAGRARELARLASRIAVVLPFEPEIYRAHGGRAEFVGHPLLDEDPRPRPQALARDLRLDAEEPVLALFPGSRRQELERHAGPFAAIATALERRVPGLNVVVGRAPHLSPSLYRALPFAATEDGDSLRALATAGLVKSGTGTLEAALAGMPFVVAYVVHPLTHLIARRLVETPDVALANVVAGKRVVAEFLQRDVAPARVVPALEPLLDPASPQRARVAADLKGVRARLGSPGAALRVVDLIEEILAAPRSGRRA